MKNRLLALTIVGMVMLLPFKMHGQVDTHLSEMTINVSVPGTLSEQILLQTTQLNDVVTLHLKGQINSDDIYILRYQLTSMTNLDMKELQAETLPEYFMAGNRVLRTVILPDKLVNLGQEAFYECSNLESVSMPEGLVTINNSAFGYTALTEVTIPSTVRHGRSIFFQSPKLKRIVCKPFAPPASVGRNFISGTGRYILEGCTLVVPKGAIDIYKSVTGYDNYEFYETTDEQPGVMNVGGSCMQVNTDSIGRKKFNANIYLVSGGGYEGNSGIGQLEVKGDSMLNLGNLSMYYHMYIDWDYKGSRSNFAANPYGTLGRDDMLEYSRNFTCLRAQAPVRADNISIQVFMRPGRWHFISLPFDMRKGDLRFVNSVKGAVNYVSVRSFNGGARAVGNMGAVWTELDEDDIMEAGKGYIVYALSQYENDGEIASGNSQLMFTSLNTVAKNNMFTTTDATVPLEQHPSEFTHNSNWNLVGNPYPCYVNAKALGYEGIITIRNLYRNRYEALSLQDDAYVLSPLEAFFVQCPTDMSALSVDNDGRQLGTVIENTSMQARAVNAESGARRHVFNFTLSTANDADHTRIVVNPMAETGYEIGRDAPKMNLTEGEALSFYSIQNGTPYAINERPIDNGIIALGLQTVAEGEHTISLYSTDEEIRVTLEDRTLGRETLLNECSYSFYAREGEKLHERFYLHVGNEVSAISRIESMPVGLGKTYNLNGQEVHNTPKGIYIKNGRKFIVK